MNLNVNTCLCGAFSLGLALCISEAFFAELATCGDFRKALVVVVVAVVGAAAAAAVAAAT